MEWNSSCKHQTFMVISKKKYNFVIFHSWWLLAYELHIMKIFHRIFMFYLQKYKCSPRFDCVQCALLPAIDHLF